jgi:hypothetical protein
MPTAGLAVPDVVLADEGVIGGGQIEDETSASLEPTLTMSAIAKAASAINAVRRVTPSTATR